MKYKHLLFTLAIATALILSCNSSDDATTDTQESTADITAAAVMSQSLLRMGAENDSLEIHHSGHLFHHHDSIYHHHDSIYVHEHTNYHHGDTIHHNPGNHHNENQHHEHDSIAAAHHHIAHQ